MTEKLYEDNVMLKSCSSTVLDCCEHEGRYLTELDRTVFFPEGGGQLSDKGSIAGIKVSHVYEQDGRILHVCEQPLLPGSKVEAVLDWQVRLDRMQQHLGEHLLSYACWKLFGANNVGFHMNEEMVAIDLDKELTVEELLQAELLTNEIIWDNRPVTVSYLDSEEAARLPMRKFNAKLKGLLRIVAVQGADCCTCCGTHPPYTGIVGAVKVIRSDRHKQGVRVEFACGRRALLDADSKNSVLLRTAAELSVKPLQVYEGVMRLKDELAAMQESAKNKTQQLLKQLLLQAAEQAEQNKDGMILSVVLDDSKDIRLLLSLTEEYADSIVVVISVQQERIAYAVTAGRKLKADCREYIRVLNRNFNGRGGGKPDCTQGGAAFSENWQELLRQSLLELKNM